MENEIKKIEGDVKRPNRKEVAPHFDPNTKPIMDAMQITQKIPHRIPFLLLDKVIELSENHIVIVKNVTMNEPFFMGHFPGNPIFPGVFQLEAMAQAGAVFILKDIPDGEVWDTYFLKIDLAKFRDKVVPGDSLIIRVELIGPLRRGIAQMRGTAWVGTKLVSEAEMTASIHKRV